VTVAERQVNNSYSNITIKWW